MRDVMKLSEIYHPIEKELIQVNETFKGELQGYDRFSSRILDSLMEDRGKRLRPALALFAAKTGDGISPGVLKLATAVELLHTATLIHDDVLDEALLRRKKESVNSRWGNEISVVLGDYLYAKTFIILSEIENKKIWQALTETAKVICMGELSQLERRYDFSLSEKDYVRMIEWKTASLMASACELGAVLGGASAEDAASLSRYGLQFGIGFQIIDDCLDLIGDEREMGKSLGTDLRKGKMTLPLIYLFEKLSSDQINKLKEAILASQDGEASEEVRRLVGIHGSLERSMERARGFFEDAKNQIIRLKERQTKEHLAELAEYTLTRNR